MFASDRHAVHREEHVRVDGRRHFAGESQLRSVGVAVDDAEPPQLTAHEASRPRLHSLRVRSFPPSRNDWYNNHWFCDSA